MQENPLDVPISPIISRARRLPHAPSNSPRNVSPKEQNPPFTEREFSERLSYLSMAGGTSAEEDTWSHPKIRDKLIPIIVNSGHSKPFADSFTNNIRNKDLVSLCTRGDRLIDNLGNFGVTWSHLITSIRNNGGNVLAQPWIAPHIASSPHREAYLLNLDDVYDVAEPDHPLFSEVCANTPDLLENYSKLGLNLIHILSIAKYGTGELSLFSSQLTKKNIRTPQEFSRFMSDYSQSLVEENQP